MKTRSGLKYSHLFLRQVFDSNHLTENCIQNLDSLGTCFKKGRIQIENVSNIFLLCVTLRMVGFEAVCCGRRAFCCKAPHS